MIILVDMDDTIEHLLVPWLEDLNRKYGRNVQAEDIREWDMTKAYPGLTTEEVYAPIYRADFWDTVTPIEGAAEALQRLKDRGHEIYIVTSTPYETAAAKMEKVLFRYFPFLDWEHVVITWNKQLLRADVMVDDGVHNLVGGAYEKILVDAPYNRAFDEKAEGMVRVHDWKEIEEAILRIEERRNHADTGKERGPLRSL